MRKGLDVKCNTTEVCDSLTDVHPKMCVCAEAGRGEKEQVSIAGEWQTGTSALLFHPACSFEILLDRALRRAA